MYSLENPFLHSPPERQTHPLTSFPHTSWLLCALPAFGVIAVFPLLGKTWATGATGCATKVIERCNSALNAQIDTQAGFLLDEEVLLTAWLTCCLRPGAGSTLVLVIPPRIRYGGVQEKAKEHELVLRQAIRLKNTETLSDPLGYGRTCVVGTFSTKTLLFFPLWAAPTQDQPGHPYIYQSRCLLASSSSSISCILDQRPPWPQLRMLPNLS